MKVLNLFRSKEPTPEKPKGCYVKFERLSIEKQTDRRAFLQSIVTTLNRNGYDAAVAPTNLPDFDIVILRDAIETSRVLTRYSDLGPRIIHADSISASTVEKAWQNRVRTEIIKKGFLKTGDRYTLESDLKDTASEYKRAYRIQANIIAGLPSVWVDPRTRIMLPLSDTQIDEAESMGDESEVRVRVLPSWTYGILTGRVGKRAKDMDFPLGNNVLKTQDYWRLKHGVSFVDPDEIMLYVHVPSFGKTLPYPKSCVFGEFKRKTELPSDLKKRPDIRVSGAKEFLKYIDNMSFLGQTVSFEGPHTPLSLGYAEFTYPSHDVFQVIVGSNRQTSIQGVHSALKQYGPYSGRLDGRCIVVHFGKREEVARGIGIIQSMYSRLNLGQLNLVTEVGDNGFIDTKGESVADYTSAIAQLRTQLMSKPTKVLALIVLPDVYASEVYYKARGKFFERVFGTEPFPAQAIAYETIEEMLAEEKRAYPISVNTASQCYVKFGGTGTAVWILKDPADSAIPGIAPGSSCYAYHDVSRRPKIKASATAYSALTDSFGRYIATGTRPIGGERLTPAGFYDILVELIQKVSMFTQKFGSVTADRTFNFKRLVFAKDGVVYDEEAEMMENIVLNGIPEERKEPIASLLKRIAVFPKSLVIDVIGVNKTPNKRLFEKTDGSYENVRDGTAIAYSDSEGLLVSSSSLIGTAQPIEISLKKHLNLNAQSPKPHIKQIMDEYYRLTHLNWSSIFKQGKYALPQILTQNLGENISAGVLVPDDMVLL